MPYLDNYIILFIYLVQRLSSASWRLFATSLQRLVEWFYFIYFVSYGRYIRKGMDKRLETRGVDFRILCLLCLFIVNYLLRFTNIVAPTRLSCLLNGKKAFHSIVSCSDAYFTPHGELPLHQVKSIPWECQPALPTDARIWGISPGGHLP